MSYIKHKITDDHDAWLKQRNKGLGGSDAGAVMGVNPYKSAYTLWAEKTGKVDGTVPDNEAMRFGRDMEDYVARRFCEETGKKVQRSGFSFQSEEYPWMLANIDRKVVGENAGLECKTAGLFAQKVYASGEIPQSYYCQCLHYMAVCGFEKMYLACYIAQAGLQIFEINRADPVVEADLQALIEKEKVFWEMVQEGIEPEIDGSESTQKTLGKSFEKQTDEVPELPDLDGYIQKIDEFDAGIKALEAEKKELRNLIMKKLVEIGSEEALTTDRKITWKVRKSQRIDSEGFAALKEEYPEIAEKYAATTESRPLYIRNKPKPKAKKGKK